MPNRYSKDRDNARANHPGNMDNAFIATCSAFIAMFLDDNDLTDQDHYLNTKKKPKGLSVTQFVVRLQVISSYMHWFPGADGNLPYDKQEHWILFFKMMPEDWKDAFVLTRCQLSDATMTLAFITNFMKTHEKVSAHWQARESTAKRKQNTQAKLTGSSTSWCNNKCKASSSSTPGHSSSKVNKSFKGDVKAMNFPCPYHKTHTWYNCFGNPNGLKYQPDFKLPVLKNS